MPFKDPQIERLYQSSYRIRNRENRRLQALVYGLVHREERKAYNLAHKEERKIYSAKYHLTHLERRKITNKVWREAHIKQRKTDNAAWYKAHPEVNRAHVKRYRAIKMGVKSTVTIGHEKAIKTAYENRCAYCGQKSKNLTIDHVIPLSKGGGHVPENIVPACVTCNSAKKDKQAPTLPAIRLLF